MQTKQKPKARNPSHKKILTAALKLFAKHGFAGTSISNIAKRAKVNQSLIYHYYKDKAALWQAVKVAALKDYFHVDSLDKLADFSDFRSFLKDIVYKRFQFYSDNPHVRRMLQWQILEQETEQSNWLAKTQQETLQKWRDAIVHFQERGEARADLSPELILQLISNLSVSWFFGSSAHIAYLKSTEVDELQKQYTEMTCEMLLVHLT